MELRQGQILLFNKFAHLYDAGVPLAEALELVRPELGEPLRSALAQIAEDLYRGSSLADAMERRSDAFSAEIVGLVRAGEQRGDLGGVARHVAQGLQGRVLEARRVVEEELEQLLGGAGKARVLHLEPEGRLRARDKKGRLSDGSPVDATELGFALARRAGIPGETGTGAFLWGNRLVRVAIAGTPTGLSTVVRLSGEPGEEPPEARSWREGRPGLLLVVGGRYADKDACLRSILNAFDAEKTKRVAVDLPVPEALCAPSLEAALAQDPDVICMAQLRDDADAERLLDAVEGAIHAVAGVASERPFEDVPHRTIRL